MISCTRCKRKWHPGAGGSEVLPIGYKSWKAWQDEWLNKSGVPASAPQSYISNNDSNKLSVKEIQAVKAGR